MADKKNEVITFRTENWVKDELQRVADHNKWSMAQTVNQLCMNYLTNPLPNQIVIKAKDLIQNAVEIRKEGIHNGVEATINYKWVEEEQKYKKELVFQVIESGGLGVIGGFDSIEEMTEEEILDIP